MKSTRKQPARQPLPSAAEVVPKPQPSLALDWFKHHLGPGPREAAGRSRWSRNYDDSSQLKLFLDPANQVLEVGYYSWPPVDGLGFPTDNSDRESARLAAGIIHEFLPAWSRSGNLLYAGRPPAAAIAARATGQYRSLLYRWGQDPANAGVDPLTSPRAADWARAGLAGSMPLALSPGPGSELSRQGLIPEGVSLAQWLRPVIDGKLPARPAKVVWMRTYDDQNRLRLVCWPGQNLIQVGYYSWPIPACPREARGRHDSDQARSLFAARVLAEFLPGWQSHQNCLLPAGQSPPEQLPVDGYRYWLDCLNEYQTIRPTVTNPIDSPEAKIWAKLKFHEHQDRELLSGNGSRAAWLPPESDSPGQTEWHTDALGRLVSSERLRVHNQLVPYLIKKNLAPPPPESGDLLLLETRSPDRIRSVFESPYHWGDD